MDEEKIETTPVPETPIRVTAAEPPPPTPAPSTKAKDPKKVSAGRAGAAARKAKQGRLLEELRAAKEQARATPAPAPTTVEPVEPTRPQVTERRHDATSSDWTPVIVGAVAVAGVAAFALRSRQTTHGVVDTRQTTLAAPKAAEPMPAAQQLKARPDPHYMQ